MIVWGGGDASSHLATGGEYNPLNDTWSATGNGSEPALGSRSAHGGVDGYGDGRVGGLDGSINPLSTGGRYEPSTNAWTATGTGANLPAARRNHTAVWTGSEMIVWGGRDASVQFSTGGRYSPSTNAWTTMSTGANLPSARSDHTATWAGTEMVVWGGGGSTGQLDTGESYHPASNTWIAMGTSGGPPSARGYHTAVWTGNVMIVWGGFSNAIGWPLNTGGQYSVGGTVWTATSTGSGPGPRFSHTSVWTGSEMIVWGGFNGSSGILAGARYDPATDAWQTNLGFPPSGRYAHTAVWTGTEMIVWGGYQSGLYYLNTGHRYDPAAGTWSATSGSGLLGRIGHTAAWTGTEMIIWSGYEFTGTTLSNTGARYDPVLDAWVPVSTGSNVPTARVLHTAAWTGNVMIVWGGRGVGGTLLDTGGRYAPSTDSWIATSTGPNVPSAREEHTAVWGGGAMIVWGGRDGSGYTNTGARYDPATDTWLLTSTGAGVPAPRGRHSAVWTREEMIVWGGFDGSSNPYRRNGGRYRPGTDGWTPTGVGTDVPSPRDGHTAVWTGGEMIVWGGQPLSSVGGRYCACTASVPGGAVLLTVGKPAGGSGTAILAFPSAGATGHDVVRGPIGVLRSSAGDFSAATQTCLASGVTAGTALDAEPAAPAGDGFLVPGPRDDLRGPGHVRFGRRGAGASRDAGIDASGAACP